MRFCCHFSTSARTLAALAATVAGFAVPACGHDWSAGRDAPDAAGDAVEDLAPDETAPADTRHHVETEDGSADEADWPETAPPDDPRTCPEPNRHDEDEDGIDDGCDNCPTYVNPDQADEDRDGLGDACEEPDRHELFSHVVGFDPFSETSPGLEWIVWNGSWTRADDVVLGSARPTGGNYVWAPLLGQPLAVAAEFRLLEVESPSGWTYGCALLGTWLGEEGITGWLSTCCFGYSARELSIWHWRSGDAEMERLAVIGPAERIGYLPDMWRRIRFLWDGHSLRCRLDTGADLAESSEVAYAPSAGLAEELEFGATGVRVYDGTAEFRSFIVYR